MRLLCGAAKRLLRLYYGSLVPTAVHTPTHLRTTHRPPPESEGFMLSMWDSSVVWHSIPSCREGLTFVQWQNRNYAGHLVRLNRSLGIVASGILRDLNARSPTLAKRILSGRGNLAVDCPSHRRLAGSSSYGSQMMSPLTPYRPS